MDATVYGRKLLTNQSRAVVGIFKNLSCAEDAYFWSIYGEIIFHLELQKLVTLGGQRVRGAEHVFTIRGVSVMRQTLLERKQLCHCFSSFFL